MRRHAIDAGFANGCCNRLRRFRRTRTRGLLDYRQLCLLDARFTCGFREISAKFAEKWQFYNTGSWAF